MLEFEDTLRTNGYLGTSAEENTLLKKAADSEDPNDGIIDFYREFPP